MNLSERRRDLISRMLRYALTALWLATLPAQADPQDCLTAPTQNCVFDLALDIAFADSASRTFGGTLINIVLLQEEAGNAQHSQTFDRFLGVWDTLDVTPNRTLSAFTGAFSNLWMGREIDAPDTNLRMADLLFDIYAIPELEPRIHHVYLATFFARAGDIERAFAYIEGFAPEDRDGGIGPLAYHSIQQRDWQSLDRALALASSQSAYDDAAWHATLSVFSLLQRGADVDPARALELIVNIEDPRRRSGLLARLVVELAKLGQDADVRALSQRLLETGSLNDFPDAAERVAYAHALLGDEPGMRAALAPVANNHPERLEEMLDDLYATLWISMGNVDAGLERAMADVGTHLERPEFVGQVERLATLVARSGHTDLTVIMNYVPSAYYEDGLFALMSTSASLGRFEDAFALVQRLEDLNFQPVEGWGWSRDYRQLEQLLAENDRMADALSRAYARRDALSLTMLAARID